MTEARAGTALPAAPTRVPPYRATAPLIHPSRLTTRDRGGVGKDLSEGWCLNFAVGCTHGCKFCYVDVINKLFAGGRFKNNAPARREVQDKDWGEYFMVPENLDEAIEETPWERWAGKEVMLSSMHDPYLPELAPYARAILEHALPAGVRFCVQTRSLLVTRDFDLMSEYAAQVRLQVSVATASVRLQRVIEPRVPTATRRFEVLRKAKAACLPTGIILAPIFPPVEVREDVTEDLSSMAETLATIRPDHIFGESLHPRGQNMRLIEEALGHPIEHPKSFDFHAGRAFRRALRSRKMEGTWWPDHRAPASAA
ncbi:MAG TPA: radical SAM protein [Candidatus Thermoplasmatota archaeon]|nr:radical SAM protein [Candidatus Thermoplasmatota archaeon]